ncbi:MAG: lysozyme [Methylobacter sp.]
MPQKLYLSPNGLAILKDIEKFRSKPYPDAAGKLTIGYGHKIKSTERFLRPITQAKGEALLLADLENAENYINATMAGKGSLNGGYRLNQNQYDALVLLVFNIGVANFRSSTLLGYLQLGDMAEAAEQFSVWNEITVDGEKQVCQGLVTRRAIERILFLKS